MAEQRIDSWAAQFLTGSLKSLIIAFPGGGRALGHVPVVEMSRAGRILTHLHRIAYIWPAERRRAIEAGRHAEYQVCGRGRGRGRGRPRHGP